jgi:thiol-disulfide isomerase/thioredoxin
MQILKIVMKYKFHIMITVVACIAIAIILYLMIGYMYSRKRDMEGYSNSKGVKLIMFHVNWCPYCKTAMPVWKKIENSYDGVSVNGKVVNVISLDSTDENFTSPDFDNKSVETILNQFTKDSDKFKIEGYPTIVIADADNRILAEFNKSTTYENLEQFINENV